MTLALGFGLGHHQKTLEDAAAALRSAKRTVATVAESAAANSKGDQMTQATLSSIQAI